MSKLFLFAVLYILLFFSAKSQDFSNKGKDFWVGYGSHVSMYQSNGMLNTGSGGSQNMVLYFTSDQTANVKVEIPATGWVRTYTVNANSITETEIIPKTGANDARLGTEGISNKGIHITSDKPVVAYAHIYDGAVSGASLLFPTNTLGQDYYILGFTQTSNSAFSYPFCFAIATEDSTVIEVTPAANTLTYTAGVPFTVTLQKGQVFNLLGQLTGGTGGNQTGVDLTGTRIRSISTGTNSCKKIAVYCGSGKLNIKCSATATASADNTIQQCFPANAWGKKYITVPTSDMPNNFFRVMVNNPGTTVKVNGTVLTGMNAAKYYQFESNTTNIIEADQPVMVAQFITTANNCGNSMIGNNGDPEMIYLSPVEQTIRKITLNSTTRAVINANYHYINVVMKTAGIGSFRLDGTNISSAFVPLAADPSYSYIQRKTTAGIHTLEADSGFNAIAYGYGNAESYGYNAGSNVVDLYQYVTLQNQYATVNFPATCKNSPFNFAITLPYRANSLQWDFGNNPNLTPSAAITNSNPVPDSTFIKDGRTLYVYKLPGLYTFSTIGTYPVKVTANNPTSDGCSGTQEISYDVEVFDPPVGDFKLSSNGCLSDTLKLLDVTNAITRPVISWRWDFGDNSIDSVKSPSKKYAAAGSYSVRMRAITDVGCIAEATKTISITPEPLAKFGVVGSTCINTPITFADSSSLAQGTIAKWYWNFGNGDTLVSTTNVSPTKSYSTTGSYTVSLIVESSSGCKSSVFSKQVTIYTRPGVNFSLPIVCLPYGTAQFNNLTTFTDPTETAAGYKWYFGDGDSSLAKNPAHTYTRGGPFTVKLSVIGVNGCTSDTAQQLTTVYAQAKANFSVAAEACLRDSSVFTDITNGSGSNIISRLWNFGDGTSDTTKNPVHKYATAGSYKVSLSTITDKGCLSDTFSSNVIINPLPKADFTTSSPLCETREITITDRSVANAGNINSWYWNFGDGSIISYTNGNAFPKKFDRVGTYSVRLAVVTDKGCKSDTLIKSVEIHPLPVANFIMPQVCLADANASFKDSSYITGGSNAGFQYLWSFGDANATPANPNTSTQPNPAHTYSATGHYNVSLSVTSNNGCSATLTKQFTVNGSVPKADFTVLNNNSLCSNTAVQLQNTSIVDFGSITRVEIVWDGGQPQVDNAPSFNKIYTHSYPNLQTTKSYLVKLRAFSGISCVSEMSKTITLNASPKVSFAAMPGICFEAQPRQITQAAEQGGVAGSGTYLGNGISSSGLFNPATAGVGSVPIRYLFTSNNGCTDSVTRNISVWPSPTAKWGTSSPTCEANSIKLIDSSVANFGKIAQWKWNFNDGTTDTRTITGSSTKTFVKAGNYNVTLQVITDSGCQSQPAARTIAIHPLPIVDFTVPAVCLPDGRATFNDLSTIADGSESLFSYSWNFGDPNNRTGASEKSPTHRYSSTGPFTIQLSVTTNNGCTDSAAKQLTTVYPQPKASFSVSPTDSCLGATFSFLDASSGVTGNITKWSWNFGDGSNSTLQNPSRRFATARTFNVSLFIINEQGCASDTTIKAVTVHPYPVVNAGQDLFVLEGANARINATSTGTNQRYRWTPATYLDKDSVLKPTTTPPNDITYRLTVTSAGGCTGYDEVYVKVLKSPGIPTAFSPNGDGINDVWNIKYLESYPASTVEIYNRYGQQVYTSRGYGKAWDGTTKGSPLPAGVYYYIINPGNGAKKYSGSVTILR